LFSLLGLSFGGPGSVIHQEMLVFIRHLAVIITTTIFVYIFALIFGYISLADTSVPFRFFCYLVVEGIVSLE